MDPSLKGSQITTENSGYKGWGNCVCGEDVVSQKINKLNKW